MNFAIQQLSFENRSKIDDLFKAPYYAVNASHGDNYVTVTAIDTDKTTVIGQISVTGHTLPRMTHVPTKRFVLPRDAFLLGVTLCLVDGEPFWFLGSAVELRGTDDRQYFGVMPTSYTLEETMLSVQPYNIVNDIDNSISLLAPVLDAQAMYQPADDDDEIIPAE